jgi:hypothetical protein
MRKKSGCVRSMNSIVVEGSGKMVISPGLCTEECIVEIPRKVGASCRTLYMEGNYFVEGVLEDGDMVILVRQPCMWTGGIRPFRVKLTDPDVGLWNEWDVNASMRLPISECIPYGADFDGDEMTFFAVKYPQAVEECKAFIWDSSKYSPANMSLYKTVVAPHQGILSTEANTMAICTTISWQERIRGVKITEAHNEWMTSKNGQSTQVTG